MRVSTWCRFLAELEEVSSASSSDSDQDGQGDKAGPSQAKHETDSAEDAAASKKQKKQVTLEDLQRYPGVGMMSIRVQCCKLLHELLVWCTWVVLQGGRTHHLAPVHARAGMQTPMSCSLLPGTMAVTG